MAENVKKGGKKAEASKMQVWWQGVKAEYKKIVWTDRPTLIKQTIVVTIVTIVLGVLISIMDAGILGILNLLIR
jgi:preprotein translocase subunit SecE